MTAAQGGEMAEETKHAPTKEASSNPKRSSARDLLAIAAWFGLVTGLVEGSGLLLFQKLGWLNWNIAHMSVWYEILWIPAIVDLLVFVTAGLLFALFLRLLPEGRRLQASVSLFGFLMFLDWALLSGQIRHLATVPLAAGLAAVLTRWVIRREAAALQFFRRTLAVAAGVALLLVVGVEGGRRLNERIQTAKLPAAPAGAPNILVVVVDALRADHLGVYGYARSTSPHVDQLARQGVLFERASAPSSWTLPSHASMLTGRHPHEHGAERSGYDGRFPTIGEALSERGYRTAAFSANIFYFTRQNGFGRGFLHFEDYFHTAEDMALRTVYGRKFHQFVLLRLGREDIPARKLAGDVNRALLDWLGSNRDRPFFAFLNYMDTHDPYLPPAPYWSRYSKLPRPGGHINEFVGRNNPRLRPEELQAEIDAYDAGIAYVDDQVGHLVEELMKRGLAENTLIIFTSDHGESFGEHGLFVHRNALYRQLIHVPMVMYWPGRLPAGVRVSTPVSGTSLPATLAELAGGGERGIFPGPSLVTLWRSAESQPETPQPLAEMSQMPFEGMRHAPAYHGAMQSIVSPEWHYIHNNKLGTELFSWEQDPGETHNLAETPEGQRIAEEFAIRLRTMLGNTPKAAGSNASERKKLTATEAESANPAAAGRPHPEGNPTARR